MKRIIFLIMFTFMIFITPVTGYAANWQWVTSSDTITYEMDMSSIQNNFSNDTLYYKTWIKFTYSQEGVQRELKRRKNQGSPTEGYENLHYSIIREEFKLNKNQSMYRVISGTDYDSNGYVLSSNSFPYSEWDEIIPGSIAETLLYKAIRGK